MIVSAKCSKKRSLRNLIKETSRERLGITMLKRSIKGVSTSIPEY
jgi:hypothetical protein